MNAINEIRKKGYLVVFTVHGTHVLEPMLSLINKNSNVENRISLKEVAYSTRTNDINFLEGLEL